VKNRAALLFAFAWRVAALAPPLFAADAPPATLRVAAVQFRSSRDLAENTRSICRDLHNAARNSHARVVVFPECAVTGYFEDAITNASAGQLAAAELEIVAACRNENVYAIVGMPYHDGTRLYNSATVISPEGKIVERYHKIHLAERWPDRGDHLSVFLIDGLPCSIIICHDERYPELVRLPVLAGARIVFYISHESGLREAKKMGPYRAQIQARAVENSVFVVQANAPANPDQTGSHGESRIIAPDGNIIQEASIADEEILCATLEIKRATGDNARKSRTEGPVRDLWEEAIKRVRIIR